MKHIAIVGGCGHVGFPLGLALAQKLGNYTYGGGGHVDLVDINADVINSINSGQVPFQEDGAQEILSQALASKALHASNDMSLVRQAQAVIFVTGTPVDEHLNPRIKDVINVIKLYLPYMNPEQLIILRSTIYPGVFRVIDNMLTKAFGTSPKLAFCPERIVQGKGVQEIFTLPQIVSANSPEALHEAEELFSHIAPKIIHLEPEEAELAKLLTNSWRYLEFAIANQFYMMVEEKGYDFYKILSALSEDYPRAKHFAKAGFAAGPCLFKDTMQLSAFYNNKFFLGQAGMLVNEGLPDFVVSQLEARMGGSLKDKKIAILGMAFKPNNDDTRESLSFKLRKNLEFRMADVLIHDPYLDTLSLDEVLAQAEGVILGVPHDEYLGLKITVPFVDCWNVWRKEN
ncbi:MAG: nucleotide sugar dehydrogenase [Synergistaceae bacterium]|nr:nucleotide sugar dehydrogenase [Synergistaceae bacterium]